jgi:plasmid stability protein
MQVDKLAPATWAFQIDATCHGRSIEAKARSFLKEAVQQKAGMKPGSIPVAVANWIFR